MSCFASSKIGIGSFLRLVRNNNVFLYVMDSSFFCMMSYNHNKEEGTECLRCISNPRNSLPGCYSWPAFHSKKTAVSFLEEFQGFSDRIVFLAQTKSQIRLLKKHFGTKTRCHLVGMSPFDLEAESMKGSKLAPKVRKYDIVYHGSTHPAKGVLFFLMYHFYYLIRKFSSLFHLGCKQYFPNCERLTNVTFFDCTWETGLKEIVGAAGIVVNPSLWSAPIEGAFLKSVAFNGNVAVVKSQFGFSSEQMFNEFVLHLPNDPQKAAYLLEGYLNSNRRIK